MSQPRDIAGRFRRDTILTALKQPKRSPVIEALTSAKQTETEVASTRHHTHTDRGK